MTPPHKYIGKGIGNCISKGIGNCLSKCIGPFEKNKNSGSGCAIRNLLTPKLPPLSIFHLIGHTHTSFLQLQGPNDVSSTGVLLPTYLPTYLNVVLLPTYLP